MFQTTKWTKAPIVFLPPPLPKRKVRDRTLRSFLCPVKCVQLVLVYYFRTVRRFFRPLPPQRSLDLTTYRPGVDIDVNIISHPGKAERWAQLRKQCFPGYSKAKVAYNFFVCRFSSKNIGRMPDVKFQHATINETTSASSALNELRADNDVAFLPICEHYW